MQRRTFFTASAALALSTGIPALASPDSAPEILLPKSSFDLRVFTAELVAIDSKTGYEEGNNRIIEIFAERFRSIGWSVETPYCAERGKALLATNRPDAKRFDIVFCAHTDTVQPVGSAAKHPFRLVDGIAYGAGVADDKSSLNAVWWVAKDLPARVTDRLAVAVVLNPGEESGSKATSAFLRGVAQKADRVMVFEPGRGEVPGGGFVKVRKGAVFLKIRFHGKAAHAGNNPQDGRSAVLAAAHLTIAITNLQDLEGKGTSVTVGVIEGGTVCNTVPEKCTLKIDTRCWNDEDGREIDEGIEALAKQNWGDGITVEATRVSKSPAMPCTDATKELVEMVNRAAKEEGYEATWVDAGGGSDANRIAQVGVPVIDGVAPAGAGFHSEREYLRVDTIENRVRTLARVLQYL